MYKLALEKGLLEGVYDPFNGIRIEAGKCQVLDSVVDNFFEFALPLEEKYRAEANSTYASNNHTFGELYERDYQVYLEVIFQSSYFLVNSTGCATLNSCLHCKFR